MRHAADAEEDGGREVGLDSLFRILDHLKTHKRKLVLMQGKRYWRIEDLFAQASRDARSSDHQAAVLDPAYTWQEESGKIVIRRGPQAVFAEAGSEVAT